MTHSAFARDKDIPTRLSEPLHESAEVVRRGVLGLRSLVVDIYPPNLAQVGLESALCDLVARLRTPSMAVTLYYDVNGAGLSPEVAGLLYRVAQEATRNVVRHAQSSNTSVAVVTVGTHVTLCVTDDGVGFDTGKLGRRSSDGHVGTKVLSDLVADFSGTVTIESTPGKGTSVVVEVPI